MICEQFSKTHASKKKPINQTLTSSKDQMSNSKVPQSKRNNRKKNPQQNGTKKTTDKDSSTAASISSEILQNLSFKERD